MQEKNDEKEKEFLDSFDSLSENIVNQLLFNEKKDPEKIMFEHLYNIFKKTELDINDSTLTKAYNNNKKLSTAFNEEDFLRFSKKLYRKFLSNSLSPKKKSSFKKKISKIYSNAELNQNSNTNTESALRSSKIYTCTNQLSTLISIRRPKKNIRGSLLKRVEEATSAEEKTDNKKDNNDTYYSLYLNNNSISKKINSHRKYSDYRKVVTFKDYDENKIDNADFNNNWKRKNRCRSMKKKFPNFNTDGNKSFDYKIMSSTNLNNVRNQDLNNYFHQFNGRKSDKRHKTVSANSNIVVNDLIKSGIIEEAKQEKKSSLLTLFKTKSDPLNEKSKKKHDGNHRDSSSNIKMKYTTKNIRKSISRVKEYSNRPLFTVLFTKPENFLESPNKNKNKKKDTFADKQKKKFIYKQKQIEKVIQKFEDIKKKEMKPKPEISEKSKKIMKKKGKHIPLYKRALELQSEKQFNFAINEESKKLLELEQNYTSISSKNLKINKNFFDDQISWKKNVNENTNTLRTLLNNHKEEKITENLSFRPKLSERTTLLANKKRQNKSEDKNNIFKRLFNESKTKQKNLIKLQKKLSPNFKPIINDISASSNNFTLRKNYIKNLSKNLKYKNIEESKKINTSRSNYRKNNVMFFEDEKISLESFPSLMDKDSEYEEIINNINNMDINEERNKKSRYFNIKFLEHLFKRKANKESNISCTELCSDRNRNNIIPLLYTKVPIVEQKSNTHRGFCRQESAPLFGRTNNKKNKNIKIPITEKYYFDANSQTGKFYICNNNNNFDNDNNEFWEKNIKKKKKKNKQEIWSVEDIGEDISEIKSENSWISKLKKISNDEKNNKVEENKFDCNRFLNNQIVKKSNLKSSNNDQKGTINRFTIKKKRERRGSVDFIDNNTDRVKEGKLFSINLSNIGNCSIIGDLKPFVIKEKQNIFYKFFRKKDY